MFEYRGSSGRRLHSRGITHLPLHAKLFRIYCVVLVSCDLLAARILRAVRITARLNFQISKETAVAVKSLSASVLRLDRGRLLMELNYMLAYGSAEASLRLLWKLGLLDILLPIQAAYFVRIGFRRRDKRCNMLLKLFSNLDKFLAPDRPCHDSLWLSILAFHEALWEEPRDPLAVAVFSLAVHNGGDLSEALDIARCIYKQHDTSFYEISGPECLESDLLFDEVMSLAASVRSALSHMTNERVVSHALAKYPKAPHSDLVSISKPPHPHSDLVSISKPPHPTPPHSKN